MRKTNIFNLLFAVLIFMPGLAIADEGNGDAVQPHTLPKNSLLADQPSIAKPSLYKDENKQSDDSPKTKDILIIAPKDVTGGSAHQVNDIRRYLGINY